MKFKASLGLSLPSRQCCSLKKAEIQIFLDFDQKDTKIRKIYKGFKNNLGYCIFGPKK